MNRMQTTSILKLAAAVLVTVGIVAGVRHLRAAPEQKTSSTPKPSAMNDFKKPEPDQLRKNLTPEQFAVTQQCGTEPPFRNAYWDNHQPGIYVDVISGEALFSSLDKFDSGSGWPSFTRPLAAKQIVEKQDATQGMVRTEVRSSQADSHLRHLFNDV